MQRIPADYPTADDGVVKYTCWEHNKAPEVLCEFLLTNTSDTVRNNSNKMMKNSDNEPGQKKKRSPKTLLLLKSATEWTI
jgi:hypothetical protein